MLLKWTRSALKNIDEAVEYISIDRPEGAKDVAQRIWNAANMLIDHPGLGRPGKIANTREFIVPGLPFILPYTIKDQTIIIRPPRPGHIMQMAKTVLIQAPRF